MPSCAGRRRVHGDVGARRVVGIARELERDRFISDGIHGVVEVRPVADDVAEDVVLVEALVGVRPHADAVEVPGNQLLRSGYEQRGTYDRADEPWVQGAFVVALRANGTFSYHDEARDTRDGSLHSGTHEGRWRIVDPVTLEVTLDH